MAFDPSAPYSSAMDDVPLKLLFGVTKLKMRQRASKERKIQSDSLPPKSSGESSNAVRSKLRESLVSALEIVGDEQHKEHADTQKQLDTAVTEKYLNVESKATEIELKGATAEDCNGDLSKTLKRERQKFKQKPDLVEDPASPAKGHLTGYLPQKPNNTKMEHGSNALSFDILEESPNKRIKLEKEKTSIDSNEQAVQVFDEGQTVACKIEAELFKKCGGVNKKYKENSRSLIVNLKHQTNPELRAHVLFGEITPKNLCFMTSEQLACKECSRWRLAKSEEFTHMVVPAASDANVRKSVKKDHKDEFQVGVQKDDTALEINSGTEHLISISPVKQQHAETSEDTNIIQDTGLTKNPDNSEIGAGCSVLSSTSLDNILGAVETKQGIEEVVNVETVEHTESLPVIISLNEYINSREDRLNDGAQADTVHERGSVQGEETNPDNLHSKRGDLIFPDEPSMIEVDSVTREKICPGFELVENLNDKLANSNGISEFQERKAVELSPDEKLWEGCLQLTASITVTAFAFFKSGEKAPTNNWSKFVEVKGRVRLDAFEKFLQELPLSRNRALMVVSIQWKVGSSESGLTGMQEVANSYKQGERVGFAELAPGIDLYVCPPDVAMINMLVKYDSHKKIENIKGKQDELVGCVVWRRNHATSSVTPKMPEQYINAKKLALLGQLLDSPSHPGVSQCISHGTDNLKAGISTCLETGSLNVNFQGSDTDKSKLPAKQSASQSVSFVANTIAAEKENPAKNAPSNMANVHGRIAYASDSADLTPGFSPQLTSSGPNDPQIGMPKALKQFTMSMEIRNDDLAEEVPPGFVLKASEILDGGRVQHQPTDEDDDDLPEFDFRGLSVTSQVPVRQLLQESNNAESLQLLQTSGYPSTDQQSIADSNLSCFQPHVSLISPHGHRNTQQVTGPPTSHPSLQISDLIQKFGQNEAMVPFSSAVNCRPNATGPNIADHLGQQTGGPTLPHVFPNARSPCSSPNAFRKNLWDDDDDIPEWCPPYLEKKDCPGPSMPPVLPLQSGIPMRPAPLPQSGLPNLVGNLQPVHPPPPQGHLAPRINLPLRGPQPLQVPPLPPGPCPPLPRGPRPLNDIVRPMMERGHGNTHSSNPQSSFHPRSNFQSHLSRPEIRPVRPVDWRGKRL